MAQVHAVSSAGGADLPYRGDIAVPNGAVAGQVLVVCHIVDNDASLSGMSAVSSGFTQRAEYGPNFEPRLKVWTRTLTAGDLGTSFTFQHHTSSGNRSWALVALACADVDPSAPLDVGPVTGYGTGSQTTLSAPALTPTVAGGLSVVLGGATRYSTSDAGVGRFTPPAAWTERYDVGQVWLKPVVYTRDNVTGSTGSANASITGGAGGNGYSSMHVVLRHQSSTPTAPTVDAGADASVAVDTVFTRTATETANGATITSRAWTIVSGPTGSGSTIGTAAALSWTPTVTGTYVLRYSATNSVGTGTDDATITVVEPPPPSAIPVLVPGQSANATTPNGAVSVSLPNQATAGNLIVFAFGGDKSMGALTMTSAGPWTKTVELGTGDSTLYLAWKVATGTEQTVTATLATAAAGGQAWVGEYTATGGDWFVAAQATNPTNGTAVTEWATGTTGAATGGGLALALWSVDTAEGLGTPSYSNDFVPRFAEPGETVTSRGGLWVAERDVIPGATVSSTLSRPNATQPDQMAGAMVVFAREAPHRTLTSTWLGIDTILARTTGEPADTVRVAYSASAAMTGPTFTAATAPDSRGVTKHAVPGSLPADTDHWYQVERGGTLLGAPRAFRTLPATGEASYSFGFASCRDHIGDAPILADAINRGVSFFVQHGDLHYRDITTNNEASFHTAYDELHTRTQLNNLLAGVPTTYTWSDHDGPLDATSAARPAAQTVYRDRVPHPTLPSTTGIYHTFRAGRVRFIVLDTRSYASPATNTDGASKTKIGAEQKTWLQNLLATPDTPLTMIVSAEGWIGGAEAGRDHWGLYQNERSQIGAWITASPTRCVMLCGDAHMLAIDDGTNSVAGVPVWHAAALARAGSVKGGPYSGGTLAGSGQYGYVEIVDAGSEITATYRGIKSDTTVWNSHTVLVDLVIPIEVDDARAATTASSPLLGQHTVVDAAGARSATTATAIQVAQTHPVTVAVARAATTAGQALLTQHAVLEVATARAAAPVTVPLLGQRTVLEAYPARSLSYADNPALGLAIFNLRADTTAGRPTVTQHTTLTVGGARAATTSGAPLLAVHHALTVHGARAASQAETPLLTAPLILTAWPARADSSITEPVVGQHAPLTAVRDLTTTTAVTRLQVTAKQVLQPHDVRSQPGATWPLLTHDSALHAWDARSLTRVTLPSLVPDPATEARNPTDVMVLPDIGVVRVELVSLPHTVTVNNNSKIHVFEARGTVLETF